MRYLSRISIIALVLFIAGCGYHVSSGRGSLSSNFGYGIESVTVPIFKNETLRSGVEGVITGALVDELVNIVSIKSGIKSKENAEAIIEGVVKSYELSAKSFGDGDVVSEYRLTVTYSVRLLETVSGVVLWQDNNVSAYADFLVDISSVAITKDRESKALEEIAFESARLVRERMAEPIR